MNSRDKGKRGELELAEVLREHGYEGARRGQQFKGGGDSPDIADAIPGVHIECKRVESGNLYAWLEQATRDAAPGNTPIVMHRRNGRPHHPRPWVAILKLDDLVDILRRN